MFLYGSSGEIRTHGFTDLQSVALGRSATEPYGTSTRIRTLISQLSVATEYKPAVLPLNYRGEKWRRLWESNPLAVSLRRQISNLLHYHPAQSPQNYIVGPLPCLKPTVPPSSFILLITSSKRIGLKSVCSTQTH